MELFDIRVYPDPVLEKAAQDITDIDKKMRGIIQKMVDTMLYSANGVGLAAPQVGISSRVAVINPSLGQKRESLTIINPKILASEDEIVAEEGCLSFPEIYAPVKRARRIEIEFYDLNERAVKMVAEDFLARVLQHEIDHLNGILFLKRMSRLRRDFVKMRYLKKLKKKGE